MFVDDVSISPGGCPPPGNCDFEDGIGCGWIQDTQDDLDWLILKADSPENFGGPIYDHTNMAFDGKSYTRETIFSFAGYFALVGALGLHASEGKRARLYSPMFLKSDETFCLHFWFSASGPNIGTLQVYRAKVSDVAKKAKIWEFVAGKENTVSDAWSEGQIQYVVSFPLTIFTTFTCLLRESKTTLPSHFYYK